MENASHHTFAHHGQRVKLGAEPLVNSLFCPTKMLPTEKHFWGPFLGQKWPKMVMPVTSRAWFHSSKESRNVSGLPPDKLRSKQIPFFTALLLLL